MRQVSVCLNGQSIITSVLTIAFVIHLCDVQGAAAILQQALHLPSSFICSGDTDVGLSWRMCALCKPDISYKTGFEEH